MPSLGMEAFRDLIKHKFLMDPANLFNSWFLLVPWKKVYGRNGVVYNPPDKMELFKGILREIKKEGSLSSEDVKALQQTINKVSN